MRNAELVTKIPRGFVHLTSLGSTENLGRQIVTSMDLGEDFFSRFLGDRTLFLGSEIREENANSICAQLLLLAAEDPDKDIYLCIDSPGGLVTAGMAIHDIMQTVQPDVVTVAVGQVAGMGQFLLSAGTRGKRFALRRSRVMMCQPLGGIGGTASDIKLQAELVLYLKRQMAMLTADRTGQTVETIQRDSDRSRWFTADEALEYGLIDHVVSDAGDIVSGGARPRIGERIGSLPIDQGASSAQGAQLPDRGLDERVYTELLKNRALFLGSEVTDEMARAICGQLLLLAAEDPDKDIHLYINSPGGSVTAGMAIHDTMQFIKPDVVTVTMGQAAAMGQFLLSAGARGKRYALRHARVMMCQPLGGIGGTASDIKLQAELILYMKRLVAELTAEQTGQTVDTIQRDSDRDRWFTAEQALEYGLVDHVVTDDRDASDGGVLPRTVKGVGDHLRDPSPSSGTGGAKGRNSWAPQPSEMDLDGSVSHRLLKNRILVLGPEIRDEDARATCLRLLLLASENPDQDIYLYINSSGGSAAAGMAIYCTMQILQPDVVTVATGLAVGVGLFLLSAGAKGKRHALPHARVMLHQPRTGPVASTTSDSEVRAVLIQHLKEPITALIAAQTGQTVETIERDSDRDRWFAADQACGYGLVDHVVTHARDSSSGCGTLLSDHVDDSIRTVDPEPVRSHAETTPISPVRISSGEPTSASLEARRLELERSIAEKQRRLRALLPEARPGLDRDVREVVSKMVMTRLTADESDSVALERARSMVAQLSEGLHSGSISSVFTERMPTQCQKAQAKVADARFICLEGEALMCFCTILAGDILLGGDGMGSALNPKRFLGEYYPLDEI